MQTIPFHIAYLLTRHEYVIVPGLGGFVVSSSDKEKASRWGSLSPPENVLEFAPELTHDDGVLADSIAKEKAFSYKEANLLIDQYVARILHSLDEGKNVQIPGVGTLYSKDDKLLFQANKTLSCNSPNYGLTKVSLPYLSDLQRQTNSITPQKENKKTVYTPNNRKFIIYTCSITVALLAIYFIITKLSNDRFSTVQTQSKSIARFSLQNTDINEKNALEPEIHLPVDSSVIDAEISTPQPEEIKLVRITRLHYYIVIADSPELSSANKFLEVLQSKGFENAAILSTDERYRIYTNDFEDKREAEQFLIQFRKDYPEYANAWLLSSLPPNPSE